MSRPLTDEFSAEFSSADVKRNMGYACGCIDDTCADLCEYDFTRFRSFFSEFLKIILQIRVFERQNSNYSGRTMIKTSFVK